MLALVIKYWRFAAAFAVIAALFSAGFYLDNRGYNRAVAKYEAMRVEAAKKAQKKIVENGRRLNAVNGEIENAPEDVACGALIDAFIKRVR